jgi:hypothetical protein
MKFEIIERRSNLDGLEVQLGFCNGGSARLAVNILRQELDMA